MIRIISGLILAVSATFCLAASEAPVELASNAPTSYTVLQGDTLWGISGKFLKEPWRWPELWGMNKTQIKNPHLIYPGDTIFVEKDASGKPVLRLRKRRSKGGVAKIEDGKVKPTIYVEHMEEAIPSIPPNEIMPFISLPLIVEVDGMVNEAQIVATQQDRVFLGNGDKAYVKNADPEKEHWQMYRNGRPLKDPADAERILGYEAFYLGTAKQIKPGSPATFEVVAAKQEIGRDDRLIPAIRPALVAYVPHKPETMVDGQVVDVYGGVGSAGQGSIISISRGEEDGIEVGHVLSLEKNRVLSLRDDQDQKIDVTIPPERVGLAFVFRTFKNISYALIVSATATIDIHDFAKTPE